MQGGGAALKTLMGFNISPIRVQRIGDFTVQRPSQKNPKQVSTLHLAISN